MKKKMTVLCGLLMAVVITAYSVSGTYAKYTSSMETTDSARVARWSINVGEAKTLNLFKATYGAGNEIASANGTDLVVAPGASGQVDIALSGTAEVAYKLAVTATVVNNVIYDNAGGVSPIKFSLDGTNWFEYTDLSTKLSTELGAKTYNANESLDGKKVTLYWAWAYDAEALADMGFTPVDGFDYDKADTALGTKYQGTVVTDADAFAAVIAENNAWKLAAEAGNWTSLDDVTNETTKGEISAAMVEYKNAHSAASDPTITITLNITATQVEPTA